MLFEPNPQTLSRGLPRGAVNWSRLNSAEVELHHPSPVCRTAGLTCWRTRWRSPATSRSCAADRTPSPSWRRPTRPSRRSPRNASPKYWTTMLPERVREPQADIFLNLRLCCKENSTKNYKCHRPDINKSEELSWTTPIYPVLGPLLTKTRYMIFLRRP